MSDDPYADRRHLTFEQAEGASPIPPQLKPKEISEQLRALLWRAVYESLDDDRQRAAYGKLSIGGNWREVLYDFFTQHVHGMADEFTREFEVWRKRIADII